MLWHLIRACTICTDPSIQILKVNTISDFSFCCKFLSLWICKCSFGRDWFFFYILYIWMDKRVGVRKRFDIYPVHHWSLNGNGTLSGEVTQKFLPPFWKGFCSIRKGLAPFWSKFFLLELAPFLEGASQAGSHESCALIKMKEKLPSV